MTEAKGPDRASRILLWSARITGAVMVAMLAFAIVANFVLPGERILPRGWEWFGLAMFPVGVLVGYALAFRRALVGACAALGCLLAWLSYVRFASGIVPVAAIVAVPGVLYVAHYMVARRKETAS